MAKENPFDENNYLPDFFNGMTNPAPPSKEQTSSDSTQEETKEEQVNYFGTSGSNFVPEIIKPLNQTQSPPPNQTKSTIGERRTDSHPALPEQNLPLGNPVDMQDAVNNLISLKTNPTGGTPTTSVMSGVAQSIGNTVTSNPEEYQTVAQQKFRERTQDFSIIALQAMYLSSYSNTQNYLDSALAYSQTKGGIASLDARGNALVEQINHLEGVDAILGKQEFTLDTLKKTAGKTYQESILQNDGKLHLTTTVDDAVSMSMESISLNSVIGQREDNRKITGNDLLSDLGEFHENLNAQNHAVMVLQASHDKGESNANAWHTLVSGNYQALDKRLHLTERYNAMIKDTTTTAGRTVREELRHSATIDHFTGKEEEVKKLLSAVDENGQSIFSEEELAQLQECIQANGFNHEMLSKNKLQNAAENAKRRWMTEAFDETQQAGLNVIIKGKRIAKLGTRLTDSYSGFRLEHKANRTEEQTRKLIDKVSQRDKLSPKEMQKAEKRLQKLKEKNGVSDNSELLDKVKASTENAKKQRQARKEIQRATRGVDKTQARIALNRLRNEDRIRKTGQTTKHLAAQQKSLEKRLNQELSRQAKKRGTKKIGKEVGKQAVKKGAKATGSKFFGKLLTKPFLILLLVIGLVLLAAFLIVLIIILIVCLLLFGLEDNGNVDSSGQRANDLQIINEQMSDYEDTQLTELLKRIIETTQLDYDNDSDILAAAPDYSSYYDPYISSHVPLAVKPDYRIFDEYGKPAGICNCMQLLSIYRFYYLYVLDDECDTPDYWIKEFKKGRLEDGWKRTHTLVPYGCYAARMDDPDIDPDSVKKWDSRIQLSDLELQGDAYEDEIDNFYHRHDEINDNTCDNTVTVMVPEDQYNIFGYCGTSWEPYIMCAGHVKSIGTIQTETDMRNIAKGKKLKCKAGYITWEDFEENDMIEYLESFLGTYEEDYSEGYELYADLEVYFGSSKNLLTKARQEELLAQIEAVYGPCTEEQKTLLLTAMEGCGHFTYSPGGHSWKTGMKGGRVDCSGFMTWILNNSGINQDPTYGVLQQYTTTTLSLRHGHTTDFTLADLKPGSILVKGEPGGQSAFGAGNLSTGSGNHTVLWLGYLPDENGIEIPYIIDCSTSNIPGGSALRPAPSNINQYQTAIPFDALIH